VIKLIEIKQFDGKTVTPKDDALLYDFLIGGSGIVEGCEVTHLGSNSLLITAGRGVIKGRIFVVTEETILATVSDGGTKQGRLLVKVDVANPTTPISFVTQMAATLPNLVQEDINRDGDVYELPLATYDINEIAVSNLVLSASAAPLIKSHSQAISTITGLQDALNAKLAASIYTAGDILTKLLSVDGSGSGIDADKIDNYDAVDIMKRMQGLPANANYDAVEYGESGIRTIGDATNHVGGPGISWGVLVTTNGAYKKQEVFNYIGEYAVRFYNGVNAWTPWFKVYHGGNDGHGSGLDADLLDGNHASAFAAASALANYLSLSGGTLSGPLSGTSITLSNLLTALVVSVYDYIGLQSGADLIFYGGGWNTGHITMNGYHIWIDGSGKMRKKNGAPTSDTDGTVVGAES
jgi:hypothetical protein